MKNQKLLTSIILIIVACLSIFVYSQDKNKAVLINQQKILEATPFDTVVLMTLVAMELTFKVKEEFLPGIHKDDYNTIILNTTKRLVLSRNIANRVSPPAPPADSTTSGK